MNLESDKILIERSISGDRIAQGEIYRKYVSAMYHTAVRLVKSRETAKDLTQDSFIKVFQELTNYRSESTLGAWIKRITINTCLNFLKREGQLRELELEIPIIETTSESPEINTLFKVEEIHKAIKELPNGARTVLSLFLIEGYQHQEIAEILNVSVSTSKSQLSRGKRILKKQLLQKNRNEA